MKAVVLAAGKATRLHPLTLLKPKSLLTVGNKTILDHQIENVIRAGIKELVLVVGFQKDLLKAHLKEKNYPLLITFIDNETYDTSGPVTSLSYAKKYLTGSIIFFHCDVLFDQRAINELLDHKGETVFLYRNDSWDEEAGKIRVDQFGKVLELGKHIQKDRSSGEYLQIAKFGETFLSKLSEIIEKRVEEGRDGYTIDAFNEILNETSATAQGLSFDGSALEIDTPEDYAEAKKVWAQIS